jgi:hypothetical protein
LAPGDEGELPNETRVLYLSPLKALARDVQKNLEAPLQEIRAIDPSLHDVRVAVRTGDTRSILKGRLEALGPIESSDPLLFTLEAEGTVLRGRFIATRSMIAKRD